MGADAVVLAGHSVDPYNGKCLRASAGSIFAIPVVAEPDAAHAVGGADAMPACRCWRRPSTAKSASTTPTVSVPTAWLFGPESHGLPTELADMAAHRVRITDARQRRKPQCGVGRGDLPVPERTGAPRSAK